MVTETCQTYIPVNKKASSSVMVIVSPTVSRHLESSGFLQQRLGSGSNGSAGSFSGLMLWAGTAPGISAYSCRLESLSSVFTPMVASMANL